MEKLIKGSPGRSKAQTNKKQEETVFIPDTRRVPGTWDVAVVVVVVVFTLLRTWWEYIVGARIYEILSILLTNGVIYDNHIYVVVEKLIKGSPVGSKAQKNRKRRKSSSYLVPGMYLVPGRFLLLLLLLLFLLLLSSRYYALRESIQWVPAFEKYPVKKVCHI